MRWSRSRPTRSGSTCCIEGTGDITDNDILLASASNAIVVGFNTKVDPQARRTAEAEGVDVRLYDIIYQLTDEMGAALNGLLEPEEIEVVEGRAEVRQIFRAGTSTVICGSYVTDGRIVRGGARVYRGGKLIATDKIESLRRFRDDVREVARRATSAASAWPTSTSSKKATSSSASPSRRSRVPASRRPRAAAQAAMSERTARLDELLREEITTIVGAEVDDPRIGFVTITERRGHPGPPPCQRMGVGHRLAGRAGRPPSRAQPRDAVRAPALGPAAPAAHPPPPRRERRHRRARHAGDAHPRRARGRRRSRRRRAGPVEPLPTPVARLPHEGDQPDEPPSAVPPPEMTPKRRRERRPTSPDASREATMTRRPARTSPRPCRTGRRPPAAARRVLAVGHENPDADTLGASLAVARLVGLGAATAAS